MGKITAVLAIKDLRLLIDTYANNFRRNYTRNEIEYLCRTFDVGSHHEYLVIIGEDQRILSILDTNANGEVIFEYCSIEHLDLELAICLERRSESCLRKT